MWAPTSWSLLVQTHPAPTDMKCLHIHKSTENRNQPIYTPLRLHTNIFLFWLRMFKCTKHERPSWSPSILFSPLHPINEHYSEVGCILYIPNRNTHTCTQISIAIRTHRSTYTHIVCAIKYICVVCTHTDMHIYYVHMAINIYEYICKKTCIYIVKPCIALHCTFLNSI